MENLKQAVMKSHFLPIALAGSICSHAMPMYTIQYLE